MRRRTALLTLVLLAGLIVGTYLWLRAQQRQYALNRALIAALMKDDNRQALVLVKEGADPNTHFDPTPVPSLAQFMKQLVHRSKPPQNDSPTALFMAFGIYSYDKQRVALQWPLKSRLNDLTLLKTMLEHGANVNAKDMVGWTPLAMAVIARRPEMVRLLLDHGANANIPDHFGDAVLFQAMGDDANKDIVRLLLAHGADPNHADQFGNTPLFVAQRSSQPGIVVLLKRAGARK